MTKVILLGTGTPNPDPYRMGPCVGVLYKSQLFLFDAGTGIVRRLNEVANKLGIQVNQIHHGFISHLHSDHTLGLSDLIVTPWILGRKSSLHLYGPKGLAEMVGHLKAAYAVDIHERINGLEKANTTGIDVVVHPLKEGIVYQDKVTIEAFPVRHGSFEAYGFKVVTPDKTVVISGDTAPCATLVQRAKGCDILVHEVYYGQGLQTRSPQWQKYHSTVHTSGYELGEIASKVQPQQLVLYHQLFMQETILEEDMEQNDAKYAEAILNEIRLKYNGTIVYGKDLMIIE